MKLCKDNYNKYKLIDQVKIMIEFQNQNMN